MDPQIPDTVLNKTNNKTESLTFLCPTTAASVFLFTDTFFLHLWSKVLNLYEGLCFRFNNNHQMKSEKKKHKSAKLQTLIQVLTFGLSSAGTPNWKVKKKVKVFTGVSFDFWAGQQHAEGVTREAAPTGCSQIQDAPSCTQLSKRSSVQVFQLQNYESLIRIF